MDDPRDPKLPEPDGTGGPAGSDEPAAGGEPEEAEAPAAAEPPAASPPESPAEEPAGEPEAEPPAPVGPAETVEQPRVDELQDTVAAHPEPVDPWSGHDETVVGGVEPVPEGEHPIGDAGPTGTGILPAVPPAEPPAGPDAPRWSARAQVPTPGTEYGQADWDQQGWSEPAERPRSVLLPALITAAILILLAIIGLGLYLALHNQNNSPTVPPPATTTTRRPTTPATTKTPPTTTTPPPTTNNPATVAVPDLSGRTVADAQGILGGLGLAPGGLTLQPNDTVPAGRVIGTDPAAGANVQPGSAVNLIVSSGPAPTTPPTTPSPGES